MAENSLFKNARGGEAIRAGGQDEDKMKRQMLQMILPRVKVAVADGVKCSTTQVKPDPIK